MLPVIQIDSVALQTPGLILLLGLWLSLSLSDRYASKFEIQPAAMDHLALIGLIALAVGGRLIYAAEHFNNFLNSPASLISLNIDLWDLPGGVVTGLIASGWFASRQKIDFGRLLDSLTPALAIWMVALGLSHLASGKAFGDPAHLPWSIFLYGEWRHPSQVYETLGALLILLWVVIYLARGYPKGPMASAGRFFLAFAAWNAVLRIFLEAFRGDSTLLGPFRAAQVGAWIILVVCLVLLGKRSKDFNVERF